MSLVISDEIVRASGLSAADLLLEIMILLFQQNKISLGKASEILGMNQIRFQRLLAERGITVHYDVDEFQEDLQHLRALGWRAIVVSDTSPLSNLALVDVLFLLKEIYNTVVIPQAVAEELSNAKDEDQRIAVVLSLDWVEVRQATNLELIAGLRNEYLLDRGEAFAIALALELNADELLIDERLGRREAT